MYPYYPRQETSITLPGELVTSPSLDIPGTTSFGEVESTTVDISTLTGILSSIEIIASTTETTSFESSPTTFSETSISSTETPTTEQTTTTPSTISLSSSSRTPFFDTTSTPASTSNQTFSEFSTTSLTTVTTSIDGRLTTYTSAIPTSLIESGSKRNGDSSRTGLIAGLTTGLVVLLCLLLGVVFAYRRHRRRRNAEAELAAEKKRKENRSLLEGEGFDDDVDEVYGLAMREQGRDPRSVTTPYVQERSGSPTLSILRSRAASETGSIFREDVWPPPADDLVDPIVKTSSQVDLGRVVDDVMGPSHSRNNTDSTIGSSNSLFIVNGGSPPREPSLNSQYMDHGSQSIPGLRPASASYPSPYPSFTSAAALASSSSLPPQGLTLTPLVPPPVLTTHISSSPVSLHRPTSPNTLRSSSPESPSSFTSGSPLDSGGPYSLSPAPPSPTSPVKPQRLSSSVPKRSSPLARRLSQDARTWLTRTPASSSHPKHGTS